ncbi:hypothetical protein RND81_01G144700 [Saponaria officinalis]|uniref:Uncharacterized protein n=1 Tax=Saponaria officinalis TaxID=3572 RepID=A0AAW1NFB5_SAPOF
MMLCSSVRTRIQTWLRDYDQLQSFAVFLLYLQIGFALVGSLGAMYNGVSLVNLAIALFALVAIQSGSQSLGRTYALLLLSAILLDFVWFLLFSYDIWISSSFVWIQMYRLGVSHVESAVSREGDFDLRNSFLTPTTPAVCRQSSDSEDPLGGSIYDPAYYYSLFEVGQNDKLSHEGGNVGDKDGDSSSQVDTCTLKLSLGNAFQATMDDNTADHSPNLA